MRVEISVDSIPFSITTRDPELMGRWLAEVFTAVDWTPATRVEMHVYPLWATGQDPDWITDTRVLTRNSPVRSPQEFIDALQAQIDDLEKLRTAEQDDARGPAR